MDTTHDFALPYNEQSPLPSASPAIFSEEPLVATALRNIQRSRALIEGQRQNILRAWEFYSGHHYQPDDLSYLRKMLKSSAAFNVAQKFIRAVSGLERRSREYVEFIPADITNTPVGLTSDFITQLYQWVLSRCNGEDERSTAFEDHLVGGIGWTETFIDSLTNPEGLVAVKHVDSFEMLWDTTTQETNLANMEWVARIRQVPLDMAEARWPEHALFFRSLVSQEYGDGGEDFSQAVPYLWATGFGRPAADLIGKPDARHLIPAIDYQWRSYERGTYFYDPTKQQALWMPQPMFEAYRNNLARYGVMVTDSTPQVRARYQRINFVGHRLIHGPLPLPGQRFTYAAMTGQWDRTDHIWLGFMSLLMDPQRFANTFLNQALELMKVQSKGGLFAEQDAFMNIQQAEENYARSGAIVWLKKDGLGKIQERKMPDVPTGSLQLLQFCVGMLQEVTGIGPDSMGLSAGNTPTGTTEARAEASQALLASTFASLRRYRIEEARNILDHLRLLGDGRIVRVGGASNSQYVPLLKDPLLIDYDIIMEEGDSDPRVKQRYFDAIMQIAPMLVRTGQFIPELLDYFPLPRRIIEKIKEAIMQGQQQQQEMSAKGLDPTGRGKVDPPELRAAKIAKLEADTHLQHEKAELLQKRGTLSTADAILKVLKSEDAAERDQTQAELQHLTISKDTLFALAQLLHANDKQERRNEE